jgi:hypothetical protein
VKRGLPETTFAHQNKKKINIQKKIKIKTRNTRQGHLSKKKRDFPETTFAKR